VANGALSWFIHNPVSARLSRYHYGVEVNTLYDPNCEDMEDRPTYRNSRGEVRVESAWSCIIPQVKFVIGLLRRRTLNQGRQNTVVHTGEEHHQAYRVSWTETQSKFVHTSDLLIFRGDAPSKFIVNAGKSGYCLVQHAS
jgi:hypothetical protein